MLERKLFKGATIIDGTGKAPFLGNMLIEDEYIIEIGELICNDAHVLDISGKILMPGIINAHTHITFNSDIFEPLKMFENEMDAYAALRSSYNLMKMLRSGVTYFRDMGSHNYIDLALRDARNQGLIYGPEFIASGKVLTMTGGHLWKYGRECDGRDDVRKAAREQLRAGVDLVKIVATGGVLTPGSEPGAPQLTYDEIAVAVEEANNAGRKTAAHAHGTSGIMNALRAGVDSIEHGMHLTDDLIEIMREKGTYLVPTLLVPEVITKYGTMNGVPEHFISKTEKIIESHRESFKKAYKAGVKIAMGSDSGTLLNAHDLSTSEIILMVESGMKPMDAIIASTRNGADLIGISHKYGTLEKNKVADFLVLNESPLQDINAIRNNLDCVYKRGKLVK